MTIESELPARPAPPRAFARGVRVAASFVSRRACRVAGAALVAFAMHGADAVAQKLAPLPTLTSRVNDNVALLNDADESELNATLAKYRAAKGVEVVVLTIASTGSETIDEYATRLMRSWTSAHDGFGDVVFVIVARDNRPDANRVVIAAAPKLNLSPGDARRIVDEDMFPRFRVLDYGGGLLAGVDRLKRVLAGEPLPAFVEATPTVPPRSRTPAVVAAVAGASLVLLALIAFAVRHVRSRRMVHLTGRRSLNRSFEPMLAGSVVGRRKRPAPGEDDDGNGFGGGFGVVRGPIGSGDFSGSGASGTW